MASPLEEKLQQSAAENEAIRAQQLQTLQDIIAPAALEVNASYLRLGDAFVRTLFVFTYPRYLTVNWFSPIITLGSAMDISFFIHPVSTETILKNLERQLTNVEADLEERSEKGLVRDPVLDAAYQNIEALRDRLQQSEERMFEFGLYITLYADSPKNLDSLENDVRSILESRMVYLKPASYQQTTGFNSCLPVLFDELQVRSAMNTGPLSSIFPFVSADLSSDKGILYGINRHNSSLVLFERFSLENANVVVFGKSGGGKSYATKLEILRTLMFGDDVMVIDPENEYQYLAQAVGGSFFRIALTSEHHINPFDLPPVGEDENAPDVLRSNIVSLIGLLHVMLGTISPEEEAIIDRAINETYASHDITPDRTSFEGVVPPQFNDLYTILQNMEGAQSLALRLQPYTQGVYAGFINQQTNIDLNNQLVVFNIRDMEDELRPIAMYLILHYVWNTIRKVLKRRILIIDEAWWMMQHHQGAEFLFSIAKRCRKYYMGLTTISQDVTDFLNSDYGKPIITNSSMQFLLKQSPAAIDLVQKTFNLTDQEKYLLLEGAVGEGLFFAGNKHVAIKIIASYTEDQIITSDPEQLLQIEKAKEELAQQQAEGSAGAL